MNLKWTDEYKQEIVRRCDSAKKNDEVIGDILKEYSLSSSMLCNWRKKFRTKKVDCPPEIFEEFGVDVEPFQPDSFPQSEPEPTEPEDPEQKFKVDTFEDGRININDEYRRETIATALFMSGYTIWQTAEAGQYFINFQKD